MEGGKVRTKRIHKGGKDLLTANGPLKDYSGKIIGVLAILIDISKTVAAMRTNVYKIAGAGLLVLIVTRIALYMLMNSLISKPMQELIAKFQQAGEGDLTVIMESKKLLCKDGADSMKSGKAECSSHGEDGAESLPSEQLQWPRQQKR